MAGDTTTGEPTTAAEPTSSGSTTRVETSTTAPPDDGTSSSSEGSSSETTGGRPAGPEVPETAWSDGLAPERVLGPDLLDLPGGLEGDPLWVSNNPERVFGAGWLMQHARVDPQRGGDALPLERLVAYMFHLNASGAPLRFHLIATNPGEDAISLDARGSLYDNAQFPISPGSGPSVAVAEDFLTDAASIDVQGMVQPGQGFEVGRIDVAANGILDGRVTIEATGGLYLYTVATLGGSAEAATNLSQGGPAPGEILEPGPNAFGRMAGVYEHSVWAAEVSVEVPAAPAHVGLALNTSDKFQLDGATLQRQTATALVNLSDSSQESFGNYGMAYDLQLRLCATEDRTVAIRFGSNFVADQDVPSFTWAGPMRIVARIVDVLTRPTAPSMEVAERTIDAGTCTDVELDFVVPGLITGGQQLVLESR